MTKNLPWKASLPFAVFSLQGQTEERWKRLLDRQCPVSKILQPYIKELKLTVLLVLTFQHGEFVFLVFTFSKSLCYVLLFSCANKNFLFWRLSNDCQIVRPALVSGPPNRKKPYNKHLISLVFFGPYCELRILVFFPSIYGPSSRLGHKSMEKTLSVI